MSSDPKKELEFLRQQYIQSLPGKINAIKELWQEALVRNEFSKLEELHRMSHSLVGSGATFGQKVMSSSARVLELYVKENSNSKDFFSDENSMKVNEFIKNLENSISNDSEYKEKIDEVEEKEKVSTVIHKLKVLIAISNLEDNKNVSNLLRESDSYDTIETVLISEIFSYHEEYKFDVIILSVDSQDLSWKSEVNKIRSAAGRKAVAILAWTNQENEKTLTQLIKDGFDDYFISSTNLSYLKSKMTSLENLSNLYHQVDHFERIVDEELEASKHVFNAVISSGNEDIDALQCWADSSGHFSGDIQLYKRLENGDIFVLLCDFTGHGLPAAVGTIFVADLFRSMTKKNISAKIIINEINSKINMLLPVGRYCAAILLDYKKESSDLHIWNCGLPTAYLLDEKNDIKIEFPSKGVPLGVIGGEVKCEPEIINITEKNSIVIFSDGITEAENTSHEMYTEERLIKKISDLTADQDVFDEVQGDVKSFMEGSQPSDDISLMVLKL